MSCSCRSLTHCNLEQESFEKQTTRLELHDQPVSITLCGCVNKRVSKPKFVHSNERINYSIKHNTLLNLSSPNQSHTHSTTVGRALSSLLSADSQSLFTEAKALLLQRQRKKSCLSIFAILLS